MDSWGWLDPRAEGATNYDGDASLRGPLRAANTSTSALINQFRFQAAKSIRTSTIILAVFNVIAAFATAVGIFWDSYGSAKRNNPKFGFRYARCGFYGPRLELTQNQNPRVHLRRTRRVLPSRSVCWNRSSGRRLRRRSVDWTRPPVDPRLHYYLPNDATW